MNVLDNRYYNEVIAELTPFIEANGFKQSEDIFTSDSFAFKVEYSEARQMYLLMTAEVTDGSTGEFTEASAWLFDDSQTVRDAESVGIDFTETLKSKLGIKNTRAKQSAGSIELPKAVSKGSALDISGFTKRVLDVFPNYKESYKSHVAVYGNFLYINFFSDTLVPQIRNILTENNKKQVKKLFELLEQGYLKGDRETVDIVCAVTAAAICDDTNLKAAAESMLEANPHFRDSVRNLVPIMAKKGKLRSALIKN